VTFDCNGAEKRAGYVFTDKALLRLAFTHKSYNCGKPLPDNERLEHLGDAVLQLVVTRRLYADHPNAPPGVLTEIRQTLVSEPPLAAACDQKGLSAFIKTKGTGVNRKIKADTAEALAAAIYLDGGYEAAERFIYSLLFTNDVNGERAL
jgi:ribonuclease-3